MPSAEARQVRALLQQVNADVNELPAQAIRDLVPVLAQAERETTTALTTWLATHPDGSERFTAFMLRQVLLQLRRGQFEMEARVSRFPRWVHAIRQSVVDALKRVAGKAGPLATHHVQRELLMFGQVFRHALAPVRLDVASVLARGEKMLVPRFENSAARYAGAVWDDLRREMAVSVAKNESIDQMTERLIRMGGPKGLVYLRGRAGVPGSRAEYIEEGLFRRYRYWAERLARTETMHAYNVFNRAAIQEAHKDDDGIMQRWDATYDSRECPICRELDGQVAPVNTEFPGGVLPPAHPNCRCTLVCWHEQWKLGSETVATLPQT